jgi:FkbM family methyltransferase
MKKFIYLLFGKLMKFLAGRGLEKLPLTVPIYNFIYRTIRPQGIILLNIQGNKMYANSNDEVITPSLLMRGYWERGETNLFKKLLKPGMIVVDIGANIGYYTLIAAKIVGNKGKIYAFEPEPNNFKLLVKNIGMNGCKNVIPVQKAVLNKTGKMKFFTDKTNLGAGSFSKSTTSKEKSFIEVKTTNLDEFLHGNKIDLIKIDAEGAEGLIFDGAKKLLDKRNFKIIMEFWPYGLKNIGTDPLELLNKMQKYGFKIRLVDRDGKLKNIEIKKIIKMCEEDGNGKGHVSLVLEK